MNIYRNYVCVAAALLVLVLFVCFLISRLEAADNPVQTYAPGRYILLAAELNVSSLQNTLPNTRKVILQADTVSGRCWVLELTVPGAGNFQVTRARWRAVAPPQSFQSGD